MNSAPATSFRPPGAARLRVVTWLVGAYSALSTLTVAAVLTFAALAPHLVTVQAGVRG